MTLTKRRLAVVVPFVGSICAVLIRLSVGPLTIDDAFITFRYARNLSDGFGLVYNQGEHVLGTTTPLYAGLMAMLHRIGMVDLPAVSWVLNAGLDAATAWLLFLIGRRLVDEVLGLTAATLFAFAPMSIAFSAGGMEGSLFVFLLVAGLWAALRGHPRIVALLMGLSILVRPEGVIIAGLMLGAQLIRARRLPLVEGVICAATIAPWAIFATWYYGNPIPQSMRAKAIVYSGVQQAEPATNAISLITQALLPGQSLFLFHAYSREIGVLIIAIVIALPLVVAAAVAGGRSLVRADVRTAPWLLFPVMYALAYSAAGFRGVRMFHWYMVPLLPFYALLIAAGVRALTLRPWWQMNPVTRWLPVALLALWWLPGVVGGAQVGYPVGFTDARERLYRQIAADYRARWSTQTVLALPEIGALGYDSRSIVLDTVGLVSPVSVPYYPIPRSELLRHDAVPPALIRDLRPDYVVSLDQFIRETLTTDSWFQANYDLVDRRAFIHWDSEALLIYRWRGTDLTR